MTFYRFARGIMYVVAQIRYKYRFIGLENIPENKGLILASNHISNFDPISIGIKIKRQVFFMAKKELYKNPIVGFILKNLGAFPVDRGSGDQSALERAQEVIENGNVLGIFPEGHRSKDGKLLKFKSGAVLIASKTDCEVVPVGIKKGKRNIIRKTMYVIYGKPISNERLHISEAMERSELKAASELLRNEISALLGEITE